MATRTNEEIKADIETAGKIGRQDVYEILQNSIGQSLEEKKTGVESFIETLSAGIKNKVGKNGKTFKENVLDDLGSYPIT